MSVSTTPLTCPSFTLESEEPLSIRIGALDGADDAVECSRLTGVAPHLPKMAICIAPPPTASLMSVGVVGHELGGEVSPRILLDESLVVVQWTLQPVRSAGSVPLAKDVLQVLVGPLPLLFSILVADAWGYLTKEAIEELLPVGWDAVHASGGEEATKGSAPHSLPSNFLQCADPHGVVLQQPSGHCSIVVALVGILAREDATVAGSIHHRFEVVPTGGP